MRAGRSGIRPVRESVPVGEQCYAFLDGSPQRAAQTDQYDQLDILIID